MQGVSDDDVRIEECGEQLVGWGLPYKPLEICVYRYESLRIGRAIGRKFILCNALHVFVTLKKQVVWGVEKLGRRVFQRCDW